ncbi:MAG: DUF4301 family protein [Fibrobacteria bacterium]
MLNSHGIGAEDAKDSHSFAGFTDPDRAEFRVRGISEARAQAQMEIFRQGQKYAALERPCTPEDGILRLDPAEMTALAAACDAAAGQGRMLQFVPASGAATRMFKSLTAVMNRSERPAFADLEKAAGDADAKETATWFHGLRRFAFFPSLRDSLAAAGRDLEELIESRDYAPILETMLTARGLRFSEQPKALIPFHAYPDGPRTAFEEQLAEAARLVRNGEGLCRLHFTVSAEHESAIQDLLESLRGKYAASGIRFEVGLSLQQAATDTLAAGADNWPLRNADGTLCFRPGGHGALLGNLQRLGGDLVFIKNIDNVVPDRLRAGVLLWRRALGGHLIGLQSRSFAHLETLRTARAEWGREDERFTEALEAAALFLHRDLAVRPPESMRAHPNDAAGRESKLRYLLDALDRPLRVCAMVRNQGEPGGGPFWVRGRDGTLRPQIVESAQVDAGNSGQRAIAASATHFNPVDLVCALRDFQGKAYALQDFVDAEACFTTTKSKDGKTLRALELPGLWNGSMAEWNTVFVEVPVETFNPVKTVNDLLRPNHQ